MTHTKVCIHGRFYTLVCTHNEMLAAGRLGALAVSREGIARETYESYVKLLLQAHKARKARAAREQLSLFEEETCQ